MNSKGLRVFVVEDEPMIRIVVADMLAVLGHTIAAEAGSVEEALRLAQSTEFDLALLDVNLRGEMITPVAEFIKASGCPIIFATAYGPDVLPEEYRDHPFVQKPFELDTLAIAIEGLLAPPGS